MVVKSRETRSGRLSSLARHVIQPTGIVSTGWPAVRDLALSCGIVYDEWQDGLGRLMLAKRANGVYASSIGGTVLSIPRQTGKTFTVGTMLFMLCILTPGMRCVWTAHHSATTDLTVETMQWIAKIPAVAKYVRTVRTANGQQSVIFVNGSWIKFGARSTGWGRGFDALDVEVFDEAQILKEKALRDMIPAMNVSDNPLLLLMGTPPEPEDPSEAFLNRRTEALKGIDDMVYVEFSADEKADLEDRKQWAKANPSFPLRTPEASMLRMKRNLGDDGFRREALGIWDHTVFQSAIDLEKWADCAVDSRADGGIASYAVDMSPDRSSLAIGACMKFDDGSAHVELVQFRDPKHDGMAWAVDYLAKAWPKCAAVVIDGQSPAMVLLPEIKERHVKVTITNAADMGQACGRFQDMIAQGKLHHLPDDAQKPLSLAIEGATIRNIGASGAFGWNKRGSDVDISPLVACTLALHGSFTSKRKPGRKLRVSA